MSCFSTGGPAIVVNFPRLFILRPVDHVFPAAPLVYQLGIPNNDMASYVQTLSSIKNHTCKSQTTFAPSLQLNGLPSDNFIDNSPSKEALNLTSVSQHQGRHQRDDCFPNSRRAESMILDQTVQYSDDHILGTSHEVDFLKLKALFFQYFFQTSLRPLTCVLTPDEVKITQLLLIKKLIHDTNESKLYQAISSLGPGQVESFMEAHKPVNRKNVIKMNIFVKIWHVLEERHGAEFFTYYFAACSDSDITRQAIETNRLTKNIKVTDQFYSQCFLSETFKRDFFQTLCDPEFRRTVIEKAKSKFMKNFELWVIKISRFILKINGKFNRQMRIPEIKFGLSEADYETSLILFKKLLAKRKTLTG